MAHKQLISPNLGVTDGAGWCLRHVRRVYGIGAKYGTAWEAWQGAKNKSTSRTLPTVSVPVYFSWSGDIGSGVRNYGHVVAWVPGRGLLSTPLSGTGQKWYASIAAVEKALGAKYAGWSLDLNGVNVAQWVPDPVKSDEELATEVLNGVHGNGQKRRESLGVRYAAVQAIVNKRLASTTSQARRHTVKKGDTLSKIAKRYGTTWQALHAHNRAVIGSNPNVIRPGQTLIIP